MKWFTLSFQRGLWLWISCARIHPPWRWSTASRGPVWQEEAAASQVQDTYQGSVDTEGEWSCALWVQVASLGWPHHEDWMVQGWAASHSWLVCNVCVRVCVHACERTCACVHIHVCVCGYVHACLCPASWSVSKSFTFITGTAFIFDSTEKLLRQDIVV